MLARKLNGGEAKLGGEFYKANETRKTKSDTKLTNKDVDICEQHGGTVSKWEKKVHVHRGLAGKRIKL